MRRLGEVLVGQGIITPAELDAALERQRQLGGRLGTHLVAVGVLNVDQLLTTLKNQREGDSTVARCEQMLERWESLYGQLHPNTVRAHDNLARALLATGHAARSLPHAQAALAGYLKDYGRGHPWTREAVQLVATAGEAASRTQEPVREPAE